MVTKSLFAPSKHYFPLNTGHRGFNGKFPENTLASFDAAVEAGAEIVELDVQVAGDGVVIVSHDPNTLRCFGVDHEITSTPFRGVLDKLTIINPDSESEASDDDVKSVGSGTSYSQEQRTQLSEAMARKARNLESTQFIPTFKQVAQRFATDKRYSNVRLMIDIKMTNEPWVVRKLIDILRSVNSDLANFWAPRTVLGIWRLDVLTAAEQDAPMFKVAHIGVSRSLARRFMQSPQVSAISLHHIALTGGSGGESLITDAKAQGKLVYTWTVNSVEVMKWAVAKDLDGIITDYPDLYAQLKGELTDETIAKVYAPEMAADSFISWQDRNVHNLLSYYMLKFKMLVKMAMIYMAPQRESV